MIQYQVLRYRPDMVSGEFVNLGVVALDPANRILKGKFMLKIGNISSFFPNINSRYLIKVVKRIGEELQDVSSQMSTEFAFRRVHSIEEITRSILPKDDSALFFSDVMKALDISPEAMVYDLFNRFVGAHLRDDEDEEVRRDKEVWNKVYKQHFDTYQISGHLSSHKVETNDDVLEFDKAWKNGAWNCFETVSFNLTRSDSIKNKVYKWMGKLDELQHSPEKIHLYLLSVFPNEHAELTSFINKKIKEKATDKLQIDLVTEGEIDPLVRRIKSEIDNHI